MPSSQFRTVSAAALVAGDIILAPAPGNPITLNKKGLIVEESAVMPGGTNNAKRRRVGFLGGHYLYSPADAQYLVLAESAMQLVANATARMQW